MSLFYGPWFVSLFFNTDSECKKQTHIEAHTYPHLAEDALNKTIYNEEGKRLRQENENCWIIILKVGPFDKMHHAQNFLKLWSLKTRGKSIRIDRGVDLFKKYQAEYNLKLWVQRKTREDALNDFFHTERIGDETIPWRDCSGEEEEEKEQERDEKKNENIIAFDEGCLEEITIGNIETLLATDTGSKKKAKKKRVRNVFIPCFPFC